MAKRNKRENTADVNAENQTETAMNVNIDETTDQINENTPETTDEVAAANEVFERPHFDVCNPMLMREPKALAERYTQTERDTIMALVASGEMVRETRVLRIKKGKSGAAKDEAQPYYAYIPRTLDAAVALCNGKGELSSDYSGAVKTDEDKAAKAIAETRGVCDYTFYGLDLEFRQAIRASLAVEIAGPIALIAKQIASMIKSKVVGSVQDGIDLIEFQLTKSKTPIPEGMTAERIEAILK